jgi:hypothetical protein
MFCLKARVNQSHNTPTGAQGERRYNSYQFTTSAVDGGEWSASCAGRTLPPIPIGKKAGWAPDTEAMGKILLPVLGIEPQMPGPPVYSQTTPAELLL